MRLRARADRTAAAENRCNDVVLIYVDQTAEIKTFGTIMFAQSFLPWLPEFCGSNSLDDLHCSPFAISDVERRRLIGRCRRVVSQFSVQRFRVLDQFSSKAPDAVANEDAVAATGDTAWVIDSATGVSDDPPLTAAETDAAWLASWLNSALLAGFRGSEVLISEVFSQVERNLHNTFSALAGAPQTTAAMQPTAVLSLIGIRGEELICIGIGDCTILLESPGNVSCFNVSEIGESEAQLIRERQRLMNLYPGENPWPRLREQIRRFRENVNQLGGYSAVHPMRPWARLLREQKYPLDRISDVLLVTDGLYRLVEVFRAYDDSGLMHQAQSHGLRYLIGQLRDLERADGMCQKFPRVKPADDASGLLLAIE